MRKRGLARRERERCSNIEIFRWRKDDVRISGSDLVIVVGVYCFGSCSYISVWHKTA